MSEEKAKNISFRDKIFSDIERITGNRNAIALKKELVGFADGLEAGLFLTQLLYWCDKGKSADGYIYKTYDDWKEEIFLSEYQIKKAVKKFQAMGILDIKVKKAHGSPTVHYKLNRQTFNGAFHEFLRMENKKVKNEIFGNEDSITEITPEISPDNKENGAISDDDRTRCFSFKELTGKYSLDNEVKEGISYYIRMFEKKMGRAHPHLTLKQWGNVVGDLLTCEGSQEDVLSLDTLLGIIDLHFETNYKFFCDYNILHFVSPNIKGLRLFELRRLQRANSDY